MTIPKSGQTVHLLRWWDVPRVLWKIRLNEGRTARDLELYTTDDLRQLYQTHTGDLIGLRESSLRPYELVAVILWRVFWARFGYGLLLFVSVIAAVAAVIAAQEGWK